ncbi:hypothetical protein BD626DRAFT_516843 [Schizophyllum amplum]|uniref:GDP-fucose protein O-fucosyltransferase-domain-containing protein n=1 Tax=Schizophyllum amplum TaxID=97359 RepID=A0A550BWL2_9AGAR|nr:hypothetical protein BD626DRAFT_516843 [Auriculariopsis ampla]
MPPLSPFSSGYSQLPTNVAPPPFWRVQNYASHHVRTFRNSRRSFQAACAAAAVFLLAMIGWIAQPRTTPIREPPLLGGPPDWADMRAYEASLPQHNPNLTFPEGASGRYLKFSCQVNELGWNNALNEVLMNAHLAYASKRAYVFQDYVWKKAYYPWQQDEYLQEAPRTPLNALVAGPAAGGEWDSDDDAPRSVTDTYFDEICPYDTRRFISTQEIKATMRWESGDAIFRAWRELLLNAPERCIEIVSGDREEDGYPQVFDLFLWGSDRILTLYDEFIRSPVSRLHGTSPVVAAAVARNSPLFRARARGGPHDPFARTLAMHVRRGDFKEACLSLAAWNSTAPDRFTAGPGGGWGWNTPENVQLYLDHCLPSFDAIVQKVRDAKKDYVRVGEEKGERRVLDVMYILTNDVSPFVDELKRALSADGWGTIVTTQDLRFDQEQWTKAAVFIGNGWSSFTSNIVHRRLVDEKEFISTRFF